MDIASLQSRKFSIPHAFEDDFGRRYTVPEKYFYVALCGMVARRQAVDGWTLLFDAPGSAIGNEPWSFASFGLSRRVCKSARKKLKEDGLIEVRYAHDRRGHRIGTEYRLLDGKFAQSPRVVHAAILGSLGREVIHSAQEAHEIGIV
jgi:hypothetical protein